MIKEAIELYEEFRQACLDAHVRLERLRSACAKSVKTLPELADVAYALDQVKKLAEATEKEVNGLKTAYVNATVMLWQLTSDGDPIRTDFVTASPDVQFSPKVPDRKKEPEQYAKLMQYLGVPEHMYAAPEGESPPMNTHWPGMLAYCSSRLRQGLPMPPGITEDSFPVYSLRMRGKKEVSGALKLGD